MPSQYLGRFAPSPSGSLHFGSLVAALGSYLRARSVNGKWLLRIEDIDPPREVAGAADDIMRTLEAFGLYWDETALYQSQRIDAYEAQLEQLRLNNQAYYCQCTRKQIKAMGGVYDGRCFETRSAQGAIRVRNSAGVSQFNDMLKGQVNTDAHFAKEDFIIKRSDGLQAYQLAVVLDDAYQGITEVVRGSDLLEVTCRQLSLYQIFELSAPNWIHLPLACTKPGFKLSKQNSATAVDAKHPHESLQLALQFLNQKTVEYHTDISLMIEQAVKQFQLKDISTENEILIK
ncbi:tRNA glutamyl-Q(34) synthetase GluQRS [Parashewanella spongiae]|uniref:Glutamyl-Q tRNA(Asp) synthetase n=1 Tax=Parashewanella spongiae TaxID=342950 RepID=A0A3A6TMP0_9GAMM|nr:tRNA glutamyl-Q(34) synthetase GluQRS [Parashewanella spongiae]MCL1076665.1 tRNA glutamyl-Q(34) synthetase GluQRS [Parashewanella spongiae]RJY12409.1 tRNA glutamyl-Q(34) synthetase GluQRS [Parashewanella spongiae]